MRSLLNFARSKAPFCVLVCFDATTHEPKFGLYYYGLGQEDVDSVWLNNEVIPIIGNLDSLSFQSTRPQSGGGLIRRTASATLKSDGPFAYDIWTNQYYNGGQSDRDFYFGLYAIDYASYWSDLAYACFFGYFYLNAGTSWDEKSQTTKIELIDIMLGLDDRPNYLNDSIAEQLANTEWQSLMNMPLVVGTFTKYPMIGRTPFGGTGYAQSSSIVREYGMGKIADDYIGAGNLELGNSVYMSNHVGESIKIKIDGTNEIVSGTVVDNGDGTYALSGLGRDTNFGTANFRAKDAGTVVNDPIGHSIDLNTAQLTTDSLDKIVDDNCYLQFTANLYDAGVRPYPTTVVKRLTGIQDVENKIFGIEDITYGTHTDKGALGVTFQTLAASAFWTSTQTYLNYAVIDNPTSCAIYFRDVSVALLTTNIAAGTGWLVFGTIYENNGVATTINNDYYIRPLGTTAITANHLYYRVGSGYQQIQSGDIDSITTSCTDFGYTDLVRVRLRNKPSVIHPELTNIGDSFIFVDLSGEKYYAEIVNLLLGTMLPDLPLGESITCTEEPHISPVLGVKIGDERLTDVIDKLSFESGYTLNWANGVLEAESTVKRNVAMAYWADGADSFAKPIPAGIITQDMIIENSVSLSVGKLLTAKDGDYEYVPVYYNIQYNDGVAVDSSGGVTRKLRSSLGVKQKDRIFNQTFDYIHDRESAAFCAQQLGMIGHAANIGETTRLINLEMSYDGAAFDALDVVEIQNVDNINGDDDIADPIFRDSNDDLLYYRYTDDRKFIVLPGFGIIDSIEINFNTQSFVTAVIKQVQFQVTTNLTDILENAALLPENDIPNHADIPVDSTIDTPSYVNDGGRSGLCAIAPLTFAPVPAPGPITLDPLKNPNNICCPNSDGGSGGGDPQVKYVEYCVGPFKPDLSPIDFILDSPTPCEVCGTDPLPYSVGISFTNFRGNNPVDIYRVTASSKDLGVEEGGDIPGFTMIPILGSHVMPGEWVGLSTLMELIAGEVNYNLFIGRTITSASITMRVYYRWATYQQHVTLHQKPVTSLDDLFPNGPNSGDIVFESAYKEVILSVTRCGISDIIET